MSYFGERSGYQWSEDLPNAFVNLIWPTLML
jgi:hypothetical protein